MSIPKTVETAANRPRPEGDPSSPKPRCVPSVPVMYSPTPPEQVITSIGSHVLDRGCVDGGAGPPAARPGAPLDGVEQAIRHPLGQDTLRLGAGAVGPSRPLTFDARAG